MPQRREESRQHRVFAVAAFLKSWDIGTIKLPQRQVEHFRNLGRVWAQLHLPRSPHNNRRNSEPRPGWKLVELAQNAICTQIQTQFFVQLPEGGINHKLTFVQAAARQGVLTAVAVELRGPQSHQHAGLTRFLVLSNYDCHSSISQSALLDRLGRKTPKIDLELRQQIRAEYKGLH